MASDLLLSFVNRVKANKGVYMKTLLTIAILAFTCTSFAWNAKDSATKEYVFKYKLQGETFEYRTSSGSYEEAYDQAAHKCFKHYKGAGKVSEDRGLDIIDTCANPRS